MKKFITIQKLDPILNFHSLIDKNKVIKWIIINTKIICQEVVIKNTHHKKGSQHKVSSIAESIFKFL